MPMKHMHVQPPPPHWTTQLAQGVETAGKIYTAATTLYHVGKGIGTAMRVAAPIALGML